jgi:hypothetical protein
MRGRPYRVRQSPCPLPQDRRVFYTLVFAGIAVLLVVAVIVQQSRKK